MTQDTSVIDSIIDNLDNEDVSHIADVLVAGSTFQTAIRPLFETMPDDIPTTGLNEQNVPLWRGWIASLSAAVEAWDAPENEAYTVTLAHFCVNVIPPLLMLGIVIHQPASSPQEIQVMSKADAELLARRIGHPNGAPASAVAKPTKEAVQGWIAALSEQFEEDWAKVQRGEAPSWVQSEEDESDEA